MSKRKLQTITKRIAKTILMQCEPHVMFYETQLTSEEIDYISDYMKIIAERITSLEQECDVDELVKEYFN